MPSSHPLPAWAKHLRPHQIPAINQVVEAFEAGCEVVFLDAPTGSGKTLIGEMVRRELDARAIYMCTDKQLQDQVLRDFPYAKVLKGKSNYPTQYGRSGITCEDCTASTPTDTCMWCAGAHTCPYQVAKQGALQAELAVLNTSYFLTEANYVGKFSKRDLIIIDEGDTLEDQLLGFVEYQVPAWVGKDLKLHYPNKGVHKPTIISWLGDVASKARAHVRGKADIEPKYRARWQGFIGDTARVAGELQRDVDADADDEASGRWLRDYDTKTFALKPVMVSGYGPRFLWRHGQRFLIMSATIISPDEMADSLGIPFEWETVSVPMTFPVENRPIILAPIADVTYKNMDDAVPKLVYAIAEIVRLHAGERILVHAVSKKLNGELSDGLRKLGVNVFTYDRPQDRTELVERFKRTIGGGVLISHSMDRGVDLKDDACTVVVIAKVPSAALGDKRVSARLHLPGGDQWYQVQAVRKIVQMSGRHVRSETDHGTTYILDAQFTKNLYRRNMHLFPSWWRDAVDSQFDARVLMPQRLARTA